MYSNKENINILTSLLVSHGIRDAVVCPGSRNAAIIHNLEECPQICCHPVTDERSAAFVALGMAQATGRPVVVCVTSGTALLNTAPAVAEATYQRHGIIVISADRPAAWIGQGAGQTMPQPGALGTFVGKCINIPEPHTAEDRWHINRLVNEALIEANKCHRPSVHINVPLSEPLFKYTIKKLPQERKITFYEKEFVDVKPFCDQLMEARRPMVVVGQLDLQTSEEIILTLNKLSQRAVFLHEALGYRSPFDQVDLILKAIEHHDEKYVPDFVLHIGGEIVSKRLKNFIKMAKTCWRVSDTGEIVDTYQNLSGVIHCDIKDFCSFVEHSLVMQDTPPEHITQFHHLWMNAFMAAGSFVRHYTPEYSQAAAVKTFERYIHYGFNIHVHYANSSAIRLANLFAEHYVWCNRGINGIEGSVSTAVGYALAMDQRDRVVLVTGDLSFFYDSNALWNTQLPPNLSILLLNNGEGGIFRQVKGFPYHPLAVGKHQATAEHICRQNGVKYVAVHNMDELEASIPCLTHSDTITVVEVFTDPEIDKQVYDNIYNTFKL
ncbi:MAG: 2-succinyl-5-enolpyruvyl-6-hydroxy-3-cyclohexene-1-carboxylic-acid synthase [Sodaliphilus sp.]